MCLHGAKSGLIDNRRNFHRNDFLGGLQFLGLAALVELMAADIGRTGQDAVNLPDAPASAVASEDAAGVEVGGDGLHAQGAAGAVAFQSKPVD